MHMDGVISFSQEMIVIRIQLHLKLFVRAHERVNILHSVLHMDIIIGGTMDNQDVTREIRCFIE